MAEVNIYKIDNDKYASFLDDIANNYEEKGTKSIECTLNGDDLVEFDLTLYYDPNETEERIKWQWVLDSFDTDLAAVTKSNPRGIIFIEVRNKVYAVSFSYAYFLIDRYCDRDFPFSFGRRLDFSNIKVTALTNPNLKRNKTVNTFIDYFNINFDSGEALTKLDAKIKLPEDFDLFTTNIELGNSIKFSVKSPSLENLCKIILYIENVISHHPEKNKIPTFNKIKDNDCITRLTQNILDNFDTDTETIEFSEYSIHATNIIFNSSDEFELVCNRRLKVIDEINTDSIRVFSDEEQIPIKDIIEKGTLRVYRDGVSIYSKKIFNHIYSTNEEENSILQDGDWYRYNDDYLTYMDESISEINCQSINAYDLNMEEYGHYLEEKYEEHKELPEYQGILKENVIKKLKAKFYREYYYNEFLEQHGFSNFDRELEAIHRHKYEVMDLYKDNCMYAVKIGKGSGKLCYAIDQSLLSLDMYHQGNIPNIQGIEYIGLWLILDRRTRLPVVEETVQLSDLKMIILKNRLDYWKKEVRLKGYKPLIKINYIT